MAQPPDKRLVTEQRLSDLGVVTAGDIAALVSAISAQDRDRANHTGSQPASTISDFTEAAQDAVAAMLQAGTAVSLTYNDNANTLSISAEPGSGGGGEGVDLEAVRDAIGIALIGVGAVTVTPNDDLDTITISSAATVNSTDAALRDRTTHTGSQPISSVTGLQAALDGKAASNHNHTLTSLPVAGSGVSSSTSLVRADDVRLSNTRDPNPHAHAAAEITSGTLALARIPVATSGSSSATQVVRADDVRLSNARVPTTHSHPIAEVSGLQAALDGKVATGTPGMRFDYGTSLPASGTAGRFFIVVPS